MIVDSTEQARERPGDNEVQQEYYSGKQQNHTFKNQLIVLPTAKDLVDVTANAPGPKSDINLFRERQREFAPNQKFKGDKAYKGEAAITTPEKKPKKGELTPTQKQKNRELSSNRIVVEHLIRIVKIFRVAQERFRLNPQKYEQIILTICGLVRLRIGALVLPL